LLTEFISVSTLYTDPSKTEDKNFHILNFWVSLPPSFSGFKDSIVGNTIRTGSHSATGRVTLVVKHTLKASFP
jgi:hypothetical protein